MNSRPHSHNGSHGRKVPQAHGRPAKPPPLTRRGKSYESGHPHAGTHHHHHKSASISSSKRSSRGDLDEDSEGEPGMASFLQFCTTCERQIVIPSTNILYCSESCRKRDVGTPTPMSPAYTPMTPATPSYFDQSPVPNIVPQMTPTLPRSTPSFHELSLAESRRASEASTSTEDSKPGMESDAARYLAQFYNETSSANARRHLSNKRGSMAGLDSTLPSLVHSPSSSYGTIASNASYRPLPPRQNPFTSTFSTKSIDLVLPYTPSPVAMPKSSLGSTSMKSSASTVTSFRVVEAGDLSYNGRRSSSSASKESAPSEKEGLSQLYNHPAITSGANVAGK